MNLKKLSVLLFSLIILSACNQEDPTVWAHFDDTIWKVNTFKEYGVAMGYKALYLYYGYYKGVSKKNYLAGTALSANGNFHYPIIELLKKYPKLRNDKSVKAAAVQLYFLQKHHPTFVNPAEYSHLGNHTGLD